MKGINYVGFGLGLGFGGAATVEAGVLEANQPNDITQWGLGVSGFAAAGHGMAGNYSGSGPQSTTYGGVSGGYAVGAGAGVSGIGTYTWPDRVHRLENAPDFIRKAFENLKLKCNEECKK